MERLRGEFKRKASADARERLILHYAPLVGFGTHAISRINGAIIDEPRAIDWIPRSVRFKAREVEKAYVALETACIAAPPDAEVAQLLGITTDEPHQIFNQISFVSVVAWMSFLSVGSERGDRLSLVDTLEDKGAEDPVAVVESQEMKGVLAGAINRLGEREKIVITLSYHEGLTLAQVGQVLPRTAGSRAKIAIHNLVDDGPLTEPAA